MKNTFKFFSALLTFIIIISTNTSINAKENTYSIAGNIYHLVNLDDSSEDADLYMDEVLIKLYKEEKLIESVVCKCGVYEFNNLEAGEYSLEFSLFNSETFEFVYNENLDNILVNTVSLNNNEILNILVSKKPDTSSTFPKTNFIKYFMVLLYTLLSLLIIFLVVKKLKYRKYKYK